MPDTPTTVIEAPKLASPRRKSPGNPRADRYKDILKTLVWVVPLTILLWFYAERSQVTEIKVTIPITVRINSADKLVTMTDPVDGKVVVTLNGPLTQVQNLIDRIGRSPNPIVTHTLDASTPRGVTQIPMSVFADSDIFKKAGIAVKNPSPASIQVDVDDVVTMTLPVRAPPEIKTIEGSVLFSPGNVRVTAARRVFDRAKTTLSTPEDKLWVTADMSKLDTKNVPGLHANQPDVPVFLVSLGESDVKVEPLRVSASYMVAQSLQEYPVKIVPIWLTAPDTFFKTNDVEILNSRTIPDVKVVGSKAAIEAFKNQQTTHPLVGQVDMAFQDKPGEVLTKPVTFRLPEGVQLKEKQNFTVDVKVTARNG